MEMYYEREYTQMCGCSEMINSTLTNLFHYFKEFTVRVYSLLRIYFSCFRVHLWDVLLLNIAMLVFLFATSIILCLGF
jgi:hypothetical protein